MSIFKNDPNSNVIYKGKYIYIKDSNLIIERVVPQDPELQKALRKELEMLLESTENSSCESGEQGSDEVI